MASETRQSPEQSAGPDAGNAAQRYRLIDFGDGRKLESLGGYVVDRPSPAALGHCPARPRAWMDVDARFTRDFTGGSPSTTGRSDKERSPGGPDAREAWRIARPMPADRVMDCGPFAMPIRMTPLGHIGIFPEQQSNWRWLADVVQRQTVIAAEQGRVGDDGLPAVDAMNWFAYTGASTMAMAAAGARVVHVDAAKPNVRAARIAATTSDLDDAIIKYYVDDVPTFAARQQRRQMQYDLLVMDPPAYGHGAKSGRGNRGRTWRIARDLWPLLHVAASLLRPSGALLITGHSPEVDEQSLRDYFQPEGKGCRVFARTFQMKTGRMNLRDDSGRLLDAGFFVRLESPMENA